MTFPTNKLKNPYYFIKNNVVYEISENQDTIFDNEGPDDYYHLGNDTEDVKALCKLLNELHEENQQLQNRIKELELLNDGLNYALQNIRKIDVEIDVGDE